MTEKEREQIALFRYGLIAPALNGQVKSQKEYLSEITNQVHNVPYYGAKEYAPKTLECWIRAYRHEGFNGLKPKKRSDRGKSRRFSDDLKERILHLREENRHLSVSLFYDQLVHKGGEILASDISYSTLYRFLKKENLLTKEIRSEPERRRFSYEKVNILWQGDLAVGPYLKLDGKKVRSYLFAFIDDCSRIVPYAQFTTTEKFSALQHVLSEALLRRGIPKLLYVDNGKIYRSEQLQLACATLGISLTHTRPYDAASKGKIERLFGTVRSRFFPLLTDKELTSLDALNSAFLRWLEEDYHRKLHTSLDMTPLDKFMSQASEVRTLDDPNILKEIFLKRDYRKVKHDGTISVKGSLFEVPPELIGQRVEVRFDPEEFHEVTIFKEGKAFFKAKPVSFSDNARVKRQKEKKENATLSFHELKKREGVDNNV